MYGVDQLILESSGLPTLDFCNSLNPAGTAHVKEFCAKFTSPNVDNHPTQQEECQSPSTMFMDGIYPACNWPYDGD